MINTRSVILKPYKQRWLLASLFFCLGLLCPFSRLQAKDCIKPERPFAEHLRVLELIPLGKETPALELAVPDEFKRIGKEDDATLSYWSYWGRPEAIHEFLADSDLVVKEPMIRMRVSAYLVQMDATTFEGQEELGYRLKREGIQIESTQKLAWGHYPLLLIQGRHGKEQQIWLAFLGLNESEGRVLELEFLVPQGRGRPRPEELAIWQHLIEETVPLSKRAAYALQGFEFRPGMTFYRDSPVQLICRAERRKRDQRLLVVVSPWKSDSAFQMKTARLGSLDEKAAVEIVGSASGYDQYGKRTKEAVVPILIQEVEEYSYREEEVRKNKKNSVTVILSEPSHGHGL